MPRFEYTINVHMKKQGKIQIDGRTESEAYDKLMEHLDSGKYDEDLNDFPNYDGIEVEIEDYDIVEEE